MAYLVADKVLGILASGRGTNAQAIIDAIDNGQLAAKIGIIITDNPTAAVLERAAIHHIPALCIERSKFGARADFEAALVSQLAEYKVDLVVLAGFMRLLSSKFIQHFAGRVMNIHPALLPAFPGLDAQQQAIDYGAKVSGCTVHFVDEGMDTGPVILQQSVPVRDDDTADTLAARILVVEHQLYPLAIRLFCENKLSLAGRRVKITE